ncbi:MAG: hypothetical protein LKCHEGNO_02089 [Burkholderiaceae bacterium]|nr:hypothetical protein [Burkholderiaceae bacterium]
MFMRRVVQSTDAHDGVVAPGPSKTQRKRQMHELQQLGQALAALPAQRLHALELPERLRDAFAELERTRSHEGRRRQLQFIGKLMRGVDDAPLRAAVDAERLGPATAALQLHEAERWRVELVNDDAAIERWSLAYPAGDVPRLRALVQAARREGNLPSGQRHARAWRDLFRFVRSHLETEAP